MNARPLLMLMLVLSSALVPAISSTHGALAATPAATSPGLAAESIRTDLFNAESSLLAGDESGAAKAVAAATTATDQLLPAFTADPTIAPALERALQAASDAVAHKDATALAIAHGQAWSTLTRGAYAQTLSAVKAGDLDAAAAWLLLRDFRLTTKFDRPNADSTVAIKQLRGGQITPAQAVDTIRADLLDTYQAKLEATLNTVGGVAAGALTSTEAQAVGLASGYWPLLAPTYTEQLGNAARSDADRTFAALLATASAGDAAALRTAQGKATQIVQSFRAAPLSQADQARRAGQLVRYLSLIPVEYGRGVKDGQVLHDIEIQEALAFVDGAKAAFADLRLPLRAINPAETAAIEKALGQLDGAVVAASNKSVVADPATVTASADAIMGRLNTLIPPAWLQASGDSDFDIVASLLDQMVAATAAGDYQLAESARIEAYAIFETGPEKRLLAFKPSEAQRVEQLFWEGDGQTPGLHRLLSGHAPVNEIRASLQVLDTELVNAQASLKAGTAPAAVIFNAATIVFREGLEAVLILASLLASMIGANRQFKRPLALGAFAAFVATVILFVLARSALLSFGRYSEQIEAVVSLLAIGVLLLVMNWFFHKVYWTRWIARHHEHRRRLLLGGIIGGQALGFVALGFTSVFREGAETVLFLQALVLDSGTWIVVQGTLLGLIATAVVGALTLVLQTKLPHKKMLMVTGVMIAVVLVTMVGSTVHTLQLVGWMPITPIPGTEALPYWLGVWFGIFGTWQGVLAQLLALAFVFGSYFLAEWQHNRSRAAMPAVHGARPARHDGAVTTAST